MNLIERILHFFNSKKEEVSLIELDAIYFHEDSYNQVELIPRRNLFYLRKENESINNFAEENFDGFGFKDIHVREENPVKLIDQEIKFIHLDIILTKYSITKSQNVYTGYSSERWKCDNTFAYTVTENANLFTIVKGDFIESIWIDDFRFFEDGKIKLIMKNILLDIGSHFDLILNDWNLCKTIDLKKATQIEMYLNEELED